MGTVNLLREILNKITHRHDIDFLSYNSSLTECVIIYFDRIQERPDVPYLKTCLDCKFFAIDEFDRINSFIESLDRSDVLFVNFDLELKYAIVIYEKSEFITNKPQQTELF